VLFVSRTLLLTERYLTTYYYDVVWTDYQYTHNLTTTEMQEKHHIDAMLKQVDHLKWQDEQRSKWMGGEEPEYVSRGIPEDCPF